MFKANSFMSAYLKDNNNCIGGMQYEISVKFVREKHC